MSIQAKPIFRAALLATAIMAGSSIANVAAPPQAMAETRYYDNVVLEGYGSTANIQIVPVGGYTFKTMRPNTSSNGWPTFISNVKTFRIPDGYVGVSRWGYGYKSGRWYYFTSSHNDLFLQVESNYCWFLRTQMNTPCKVPTPA